MSTSVIGFYVFKNDIANWLVSSATPYISSDIKIERITTDLWENFPEASIELNNVRIKDSWDNSLDNAYQIGKLFLLFEYKDLLAGNIRIKHIVVKDAEIKILTNNIGQSNYVFWKIQADSIQTDNADFELSLDNIEVENSKVLISNSQNQFYLNTYINKGAFSLHSIGDNSYFNINSKLKLHQLKNGEVALLTNKEINTSMQFAILNNDVYEIKNGDLNIGKLNFEVNGSINNIQNFITTDITIQSKHTRLEELISLSPDLLNGSLEDYQIKGGAFFTAKIKGDWKEEEVARINVGFGIRDGELKQTSTGLQLSDIFLDGHYDNGVQKTTKTSELSIKAFTILFNDKEIKGNFKLNNFDNPYCDFDLKGEVDFDKLHKLFPIANVDTINGIAQADIHFKGLLKDIEQAETLNNTEFGGDVLLQNVNLKLDSTEYSFQKMNGALSFEKPFLLINNLEFEYQKSQVKLSGYFKNLLSFLVKDNYLQLVADLSIDYLNFNELVPASEANPTNDEEVAFKLPDFLAAQINLKLDSFKYNKFSANKVITKMRLFNKKIDINSLSMNALGGNVTLEGQLGLLNSLDYEVQLKSVLNGININRLFDEMNDFGQKYITKDQLKGSLNSTVQLSFLLNENWDFKLPTLVGDADFTIVNGELINVVPMVKLGGFFKVGHFEHMLFDTLSNHLFFENQVISIPEMLVASNTVDFVISGTHSFENQIDYELKVNMKKLFLKQNSIIDRSFNYFEADNKGGMNLFLTMKGDGSDPEIAYNVKALSKQIGESMAKEQQELQKAKEREKQLRAQRKDSLYIYHRKIQQQRRRGAIKESLENFQK